MEGLWIETSDNAHLEGVKEAVGLEVVARGAADLVEVDLQESRGSQHSRLSEAASIEYCPIACACQIWLSSTVHIQKLTRWWPRRRGLRRMRWTWGWRPYTAEEASTTVVGPTRWMLKECPMRTIAVSTLKALMLFDSTYLMLWGTEWGWHSANYNHHYLVISLMVRGVENLGKGWLEEVEDLGEQDLNQGRQSECSRPITNLAWKRCETIATREAFRPNTGEVHFESV